MTGASGDPAPDSSAADTALAVTELATSHLYSSALRAVAVHRVADRLADAGGPLSVGELARRAGVHAPSLRRVLRLLATKGVFREDADGSFHLTPAAERLRAVPGSQRDEVLFSTDDLMVRPIHALDDTLRTGTPGFDTVHGAPFFAYLAQHPEAQRLFDLGMAALSGPVDEIIAETYPFPDTGTVVDVGGGRGGLLKSVLERRPRLSGVLFDQAQTVAHHLLDTKELSGRWRVESGDFFTGVPKGGDVYTLKHILHDWNDDECLRILRAIRTAIPPSGRLVAVDTVLPEGNDPHFGKSVDVIMLAAFSGQERTREEFAALFQKAGFKLTRVIEAPTFPDAVEAEPV
ncbi:methyltransferase [Streptomyces sp. NPDC059063]|uniref:methyltransferase n=1 Tax=unclassified Streptomyces TaxID=2593676 RepID=UPI0036B2E387